jgi:hypothetical protein
MPTSQRDGQPHLHHEIEKCERRRSHKRHELCRGGSYQRSGRPDFRIHARGLGLKAKRIIRRGEVERVGCNDALDLFYRRLYDVGEGLQLC